MRALGRLCDAVLRLCEGLAALLVVAEVVILFAGVIARYGFDSPLVWSDDLAGALFLWLSLLGAVIALARGEHMRLAAVLGWMKPRARAAAAAFGYGGVVVFLLLLLPPAWSYTEGQWWVTSPALEFPDALRVAALPVGAGLMLIVALRALAREAGGRMVVALGLWAALAFGLRAAAPWFAALGSFNLVLFFVILLAVLVVIGVPIAFAFGLSTIGYLGLATHVPLAVVVGRMDGGMSGMILLAVPLFVCLGLLIEMTALAAALVDFLAALLGHVRGGLAYVLIAAIYLVSGISGSKAADMAAVAPALFPEMQARGAAPGRLVALLAASAAMAETIPPSLVLITIGSVTGVSIAALFAAGLLPATLGALALAGLVFWQARRMPLGETERPPARAVLRQLFRALPALVLPFLIRFAVVDGIATATEVSTVGIVYTLLAGLLLYRRFDWRRGVAILIETAALSGAILLIIGTATAMGWALTQSGFAHALLAAVKAMPGGRAGFWLASIAAFAVLGSLLEGIPSIVLFGPLFFPVARSLGIDEVHYAIVTVLAMGLGLFAPPFGVGFYTACAIGKVTPDRAFAPIWPYLAILLAATLAIAAFPILAPH
jgi:tripartite ATP-independent transporter DctM subunit